MNDLELVSLIFIATENGERRSLLSATTTTQQGKEAALTLKLRTYKEL